MKITEHIRPNNDIVEHELSITENTQNKYQLLVDNNKAKFEYEIINKVNVVYYYADPMQADIEVHMFYDNPTEFIEEFISNMFEQFYNEKAKAV